jgi:16S rRNA (adenine1518-N6/adenine1519-N6)-dimethyltransferase
MSPHPPAKKRFGQNFLVDTGVVRRILDALDPRIGEALLEIGPGPGALTGGLVERAGRIAAVELDRDLAATLRERFTAEELLLIEGDVLETSFHDVLKRLDAPDDARLVVAGNLPYNISKPLAMRLIDAASALDRTVLMFQREVARRLVAAPGSRDYGPLTILAGLVFDITRLFDVAPGAFRPRPEVVSTVTHWQPCRPPETYERHAESLRSALRACFAHRRRTLQNNLKLHGLGGDEVTRLLDASGIDGTLRPERIDPEGYLRLAAHWPGTSDRA